MSNIRPFIPATSHQRHKGFTSVAKKSKKESYIRMKLSWIVSTAHMAHMADGQVEPSRDSLMDSCFTTDLDTRSQIRRLPRQNIHTETR